MVVIINSNGGGGGRREGVGCIMIRSFLVFFLHSHLHTIRIYGEKSFGTFLHERPKKGKKTPILWQFFWGDRVISLAKKIDFYYSRNSVVAKT